jgi:glucose-6-phosphate dehydrogenase assembly protein OpcA
VSTAQALRVDDLNHVERELLRMRARESGSSVRATTLNLVAFAGNDDHLNRTVDALQLIGGSRPLRAIVTVPGDGATSAEVSSTCWRNVSGHEVRSEQIVVTARPVAMPSAVVSLLIPDLPTFLLWNGDLGDHRELLLGLAHEATRLILDSDECGLKTVVEASSLSVAVTDLAWARLTPWREALASLTDNRGWAVSWGSSTTVSGRRLTASGWTAGSTTSRSSARGTAISAVRYAVKRPNTRCCCRASTGQRC